MNSTTKYGNSREGFGKEIDAAAEKIYKYIQDTSNPDVVVRLFDHPESVGPNDPFILPICFPKADEYASRLEIPLSNYGLPADWKELIGAFLYRTKAHSLFISFGYLTTRLYVIHRGEAAYAWENHYSFLDCRPTEVKEEVVPDANLVELKARVDQLQQLAENLLQQNIKIAYTLDRIVDVVEVLYNHE